MFAPSSLFASSETLVTKGTIYFLTTNVLDWKAETLFLVVHYSVSRGRRREKDGNNL